MRYDEQNLPPVSALDQLRTTPNLLTLLRLLTIPFLLISILDGHFGTAFVLFLLAGLSDGFDGLLARVLEQRTRLGLYLDPIADKILMSSLFVVLTHVHLIPRYVTALVFGRDIGILSIASLLFFTDAARDFRPTILGKLSTVVQILGLTSVFCAKVFSPAVWNPVRDRTLLAVAVLAPVSAAWYGWVILKRMGSPEARAAQP